MERQNIILNDDNNNDEKDKNMKIEQLEATNTIQEVQCYFIRFKNFPDYIKKNRY